MADVKVGTREEWEAELVRLACIHVLGWAWDEAGCSWTKNGHRRRRTMRTTRSIADAWVLVEKLCVEDIGGWSVGIFHAPAISSVCWGWTVALDRSVYPPLWGSARRAKEQVTQRAYGLPLAITLAALEAVGAEIPPEPEE